MNLIQKENKNKSTREQSLALMNDRYISVTANAGSGKTKVLVDKYIDILLNDKSLKLDPRKLVAITFTRKAANEMVAKIMKKLDEMIEVKSDSQDINDLREIKYSLYNARISTIHSFCSELIRNYPIEANILPNFSEMSEATYEDIFSKNYLYVIDSMLSSKNEDKNKILFLYTFFSDDNLRETIKKLLDDIQHFDKLYKLYTNADYENGQISQELTDLYLTKIRKYLIVNIPTIAENLLSAFNYLDEKKTADKNILNHPEIENFKKSLNVLIENPLNNFEDLEKISHSINFITKIKHNKKNYSYSYLLGLIGLKDEKDKIDNLKEILDKTTNYKYLTKLNSILFDLASRIKERIDLDKFELNSYTFNDLIYKAFVLLKDMDVLGKDITKDIKYLLIDEYQDTDPMQFEILNLILNKFKQSDKNLFVVGDLKQSIYGFRNADILVMKHTINEIVKYNKNIKKISDNSWENIQLSEKEKYGEIKLQTSFRLQAAPTLFINYIFKNLFNEKNNEFDVDYDDLICARDYEKFKEVFEQNQNDFKIDRHFGSVTFLASNETKSKDEDSLDSVDNDIQMLCDYINLIVENEDYTVQDKNSKPRLINFSDIKIITRSRKRIKKLISKLGENNIPYVSQGNKGFYKNPEISDLVSVLEFTQDQNNDISLAAALRSPLFSIADTELFKISQVTKGDISFWQKCHTFLNSENKNASIDLRKAINILNILIKHSSATSISGLVLYLIEKTEWVKKLSRHENYKQKKANITKFLQVASGYEQAGFKDISSFIKDANNIKFTESEEDASIDESGNAVDIMTIHASKGLESNVLILFDLNKQPNNTPPNYNKQVGYISSMDLWDDDTNQRSKKENYISKAINIENQLREDAEAKRLLYVALTRARDHLVITTRFKEKSDKTLSKMQGLGQYVFEESLYDYKDNLFSGKDFTLKDKIRFFDKNTHDIKEFKAMLEIHVHTNEIPSKTKNYNETKESDSNKSEPTKLLSSLYKYEPQSEIFSATKIITFKNSTNGSSYLQNYKLGLKEVNTSYFKDLSIQRDTEEDVLIGAEIGGKIHSALEKIDYWYQNGKLIDPERLSKIAEKLSMNELGEIDEQVKSQIISDCTDVSSTSLIKEFSSKIKSAYHEYVLNIPVNDDILTGSIDMLIQNKNGEWEIWDWKTNNIEKEDLEHIAKKYEYQMMLYATLISMKFPNQKNYKTRLLFTKLANSKAEDDEWTYTFNWSRKEIEEKTLEIFDDIDEIKKQNEELKVY